ncbi:unnamed protein product, partial [Notodromas monacha]
TLDKFGFRGEALSSLANVAHLSVDTKTRDDVMGRSYAYDARGNPTFLRHAAATVGTQVHVKNLFENLPVRREAKSSSEKRKRDELKRCEEVVAAVGVAHPGVGLTLVHNKRVVWRKPRVGSVKDALGLTLDVGAIKWLEITAAKGSGVGDDDDDDDEVRTKACVILCKTWLLIAFAQDVLMIYAGRAVAGLSVGVTSMAVPIYLAEVAQADIRGRLGILPSTIGNSGVMFIYVFGAFLNWSTLAMVCSIVPVLFCIGMAWVPETPRWYLSKGKKKRAFRALQWLRPADHDVVAEMQEMEAQQANSAAIAGGPKLRDLISPLNARALFVSLGLMFFQQLSGINAVIFYTLKIFEAAGSTVDKDLSTIIVGSVNIGATLLSNAVVDRWETEETLRVFGWLPLVAFVVFVVAFSFGFGPVPWLMLGEIFPSRIRSLAASVTAAFNWACTFIVTKNFQGMIDGLGIHGAFWLFGSNCLVATSFVFLLVPETKGRTLEQIEERLSKSSGRYTFTKTPEPGRDKAKREKKAKRERQLQLEAQLRGSPDAAAAATAEAVDVELGEAAEVAAGENDDSSVPTTVDSRVQDLSESVGIAAAESKKVTGHDEDADLQD